MIKLNKCDIHGLRGVRKSLTVPLDSAKSLLIYGDNGTGKSSISDSVEWFYFDKVDHLSTEEIGRKGIDALRNKLLPDTEDAFIEIAYTDTKLNAAKKLSIKQSKLQSVYTNTAADFKSYLEASLKENIILRYRDLITFILYTKKDKLDALSHIIGYSDVVKTRDILKKASNEFKKEIKNKDYENKISRKQSQIIEQVNQPIQNDEQYFKAINELIKPLNLGVTAKDDNSIESILKQIETPADETASLLVSYEKVIGKLQTLKDDTEKIRTAYQTFFLKYQQLLGDAEKFNKISLEKLLSEGVAILERQATEEEICPLCLQPKSREELVAELRERIAELSAFKKEKEDLNESRSNVQSKLQGYISELNILKVEKCLSFPENGEVNNTLNEAISSLQSTMEHIKSSSLDKKAELKAVDVVFVIDNEKLQSSLSGLSQRKNDIVAKNKDNIKIMIHTKISLVREAYNEIKSLRKEADVLRIQQQSIDLIHKDFVLKQKLAFQSFLKFISADINRFYLFMNDGERVDEIELIPIEENDEFAGITFQFKFHGDIVSPPNKYLSESHLNCLGISLFLSAVLAFNKTNKFFLLDDVISSFDRHHRIRFANLLAEQFSDYQILLLTHEKDWFDYVANMVKGKNWVIKRMCWDCDDGSFLELPLGDLKERIELKIKNADSSDLGNMIRRYLEGVLKDVCLNLEVNVPFRFNEQNERRMPHELLADLRGHLKRVKNDVDAKVIMDRLSNSNYLGNVTSHDSSFSANISDLKAFYDDVLSLEKIFRCVSCGKYVSSKYYDSVEKKIRCSCGTLKYLWEK
jgi:hypothetical protein